MKVWTFFSNFVSLLFQIRHFVQFYEETPWEKLKFRKFLTHFVLKLWHYCAASMVERGGKFKLSTARRQIRVRCFDFLERVVLFIWISSAASRGAILTSKLELFSFWGPGKLWKETYITEFYAKFWRKNL